MEPTEESQQLLAEYAKQALQNNVIKPDNELSTGLFFNQSELDLIAQQAYAYYYYLVRQDQLLQQHYRWQLELQAQQFADRYSSLTSFLHRQENSFLTPWSLNDDNGGDYALSEDGKLRMVFQPDSFFTISSTAD